jgi:hypothetical protein
MMEPTEEGNNGVPPCSPRTREHVGPDDNDEDKELVPPWDVLSVRSGYIVIVRLQQRSAFPRSPPGIAATGCACAARCDLPSSCSPSCTITSMARPGLRRCLQLLSTEFSFTT